MPAVTEIEKLEIKVVDVVLGTIKLYFSHLSCLQYPVLPDTPHLGTHKQHAAAMEASKQTGSTQIVPDSSRP